MPNIPAPAATAARALLASLVRHALVAAGAALVTRGLVDQGTVDGVLPTIVESIVGTLLVAGATGWAQLRAWLAHGRFAAVWAALNAPAAAPLSPLPPVRPTAPGPQPDPLPEITTMSLTTVLVSIETAALAALKEAGTVLESFVITEAQKLVAEVKQTYVGTVALNIVSALESHDMPGAEKLEAVVAAVVPLITKLAASGGLSSAIASVESFALEFAQSVYQDFVANVVPKATAAIVSNGIAVAQAA